MLLMYSLNFSPGADNLKTELANNPKPTKQFSVLRPLPKKPPQLTVHLLTEAEVSKLKGTEAARDDAQNFCVV